MSPESTGLPSPGCALAPYTFTAGGRGPGGTGESFIGVMGEGALSLESGPGLVPLTPDAIFFLVPRGEAKQMNTMTARALMLGLVIALWGWLANVARLHVSLWAGLVALGCFFAAGGGVPGPPKARLAALSGVVWVLVAHAVRGAIGGGNVGVAGIPRATAAAIVLQSRGAILSLPAGGVARAGGAPRLYAYTGKEGVRAGVGAPLR